ncbi:hypothetical protein D3C76_311910 [compost metagenome]
MNGEQKTKIVNPVCSSRLRNKQTIQIKHMVSTPPADSQFALVHQGYIKAAKNELLSFLQFARLRRNQRHFYLSFHQFARGLLTCMSALKFSLFAMQITLRGFNHPTQGSRLTKPTQLYTIPALPQVAPPLTEDHSTAVASLRSPLPETGRTEKSADRFPSGPLSQ